MAKKKLCPICKKEMDEDIVDICKDAHEYTIEMIKKDHPKWVEKDGMCPKCKEYYDKL